MEEEPAEGAEMRVDPADGGSRYTKEVGGTAEWDAAGLEEPSVAFAVSSRTNAVNLKAVAKMVGKGCVVSARFQPECGALTTSAAIPIAACRMAVAEPPGFVACRRAAFCCLSLTFCDRSIGHAGTASTARVPSPSGIQPSRSSNRGSRNRRSRCGRRHQLRPKVGRRGSAPLTLRSTPRRRGSGSRRTRSICFTW